MIQYLEKIHAYARANYIPVLDEECEKILVELIKQQQPTKILEIGTAVGYSSSIMLLNCEAIIDTIEIDKQRLDMAQELWQNLGLNDRINSILGNVDEILPDVIKDNQYDFLFLDGPKSRYLQHLEICKDNIKKGGYIIADDVLFFGMVKAKEFVPHKHRTIVKNLRKFFDFLQDNRDIFETTLIEKGNGVAIIKKIK